MRLPREQPLKKGTALLSCIRRRRGLTASWLIFALIAVTLPLCRSSDEVDQFAEPEEVLDFGIEGEDVIESTDEVIEGVMLVYAKIDPDLMNSGDIEIIVRQTLGKVCRHFGAEVGAPVISQFYMDVKTLGQEELGMNYSWKMLPPVEAGKDCINRLAMVSFGPMRPPFDELPAPPLRELFHQEMKLQESTRFLDMSEWGMQVQNLTCNERKVIKYWNHSKSIDVFPTDEPECIGGDSIDWEPNLNGEFEVDSVGDCEFAGNNPCVCASLPGCEWVPAVDGNIEYHKCVYTSMPGVPCEACEFQDKCVVTPEMECAVKATPCACVLTGGDQCNWDPVNTKCLYDPGGETSCTFCSRQPFCILPEVDWKGVRPERYAIMGKPEYGWFINITFNREMEFKVSGLGSGILLRCQPAYPGGESPTYEMQYSQMYFDGNTLHIDTQKLKNSEERDCSLVIMSNVVRDVVGLLPYGGLEEFQYTVIIPDLISPNLLSFNPLNSARAVSVDARVEFTFDEAISKCDQMNDSLAFVNVIELGGDWTGWGDVESDLYVANIRMDDPVIEFKEKQMMVNLSGILNYSKYYSLTLPDEVLCDGDQNVYSGMGRAIYIFETDTTLTEEELDDGEEEQVQENYIIISAAGGTAFLFSSYGIFLVYKLVRKIRRRAKVSAQKVLEQKMEENPETDVTHIYRLEEPEGGDDWSDPISPSSSRAFGKLEQGSLQNSFAATQSSLASTGSVPASPAVSMLQIRDRPTAQVFEKPRDNRVELSKQLRRAGTVPSLAEVHAQSNKTSMAMKSQMQIEDAKPQRPKLQLTPSPMGSPQMKRSSTMSPHPSPAHGSRSKRDGRNASKSSRSPAGRGTSKGTPHAQAKIGWQSPQQGSASPQAGQVPAIENAAASGP